MELNEKIIEDYRKKSRLTDDEYEVYLNSVIEKFTKGKRRCDNPVAIYVAGQTGAGKSNLVNLVIQGFSNKDNVVICNFDIIKTMHPKYTNICNIPEIVHDVLMPDAGRLIEDFTKYCRKNRFNIITEGTMKCTSEAISWRSPATPISVHLTRNGPSALPKPLTSVSPMSPRSV